MKTFLEFLIAEDGGEGHTQYDATSSMVAKHPVSSREDEERDDAKKIIAGIKARAKESRKMSGKNYAKPDRPVPKTLFGDEKLAGLARKPGVEDRVDVETAGKVMDIGFAAAEKNRKMLVGLSNKKSSEIERGTNSGDNGKVQK